MDIEGEKMEIVKLSVLRGPNYWSNYRNKLIVLKLDLKQYEYLPSNKVPGFNDALKKLMPSLFNHRCSEGIEGGFFTRLDEGTWFGHVIEHVALELQWLSGMRCGYGRTRSAPQEGCYYVVFSYEIENAGRYAAQAAFNIIQTLANGQQYESLADDIKNLKQIHQEERFGPSTSAIIKEAEKRNIPYMRLDDDSMILLGQGSNQKIICSTVTNSTSCIGVDIAADKELTKQILLAAHIPVPRGKMVHSLDELGLAMEEIGFPLVIKPQKSNHGKGITTQITTNAKAIFAFNVAKKFCENVIVERFINGHDYRILVVNYKLVAVAKRTPAAIVGNGIATIQELIDEANSHPTRGEGHQNFLTKITIDESTMAILVENDLTLDTILPKGNLLYLKSAANLSSGGTAIDVTHLIHPRNIFLAERVARLSGLDICGIDLIAEDIGEPITERNGAILEVNAGPGIRMHLLPSKGIKRNVAKPIMDMLFQNNTAARIPLVAVTGTNGKTTTVRLIAHFAKQAGFAVGYTTTEGIYIQNQEVYKGDCSGPLSAATILRDPLVNFAVLECARGGILRSGLGFDHCNISIITNVTEDHLGQDDIVTLEEMARVKSVVARSTLKDGHAILNADDDLVYDIKNDLECNIALFSTSASNPRIHEHCANGGLAAYVERDQIVVQKGHQKLYLGDIKDIPLTFLGAAISMIKNILPAALAGIISCFPAQEISKWLLTFQPNPENLPGRMNLFNFDTFKVLIDYAHNEDAFIELRNFINKVGAQKKVGIIAATGDRRPDDIRKVGYYAAQTFDEIIIREDRDSRGRSHKDMHQLIKEGIYQVNKDCQVKIIPNEFDAILYAMENAEPDTFILYFPDEILKAVEFIREYENNYRFNNHLIQGQASA